MPTYQQRQYSSVYMPVLPDIKNWPIYDLAQNRAAFIEQLIVASQEQVGQLTGKNPQKLHQKIARALYLERIRIKDNPWRVDPKDERSFWRKVNETLVHASLKSPHEGITEQETAIFQKIITRYANEIAGSFNPKVYNLASRILPPLFSRLLNAASGQNFKRLWGNQYQIQDRIKLTGNIEHIRKLATKGTLILVPTHFSNLDSVLIGWAIHCMGLPAFLYGAGLNLFNSRFFGYFMGGLGAYTVDRRKKNMLYIETLKKYSQLAIEKGCHSLFFPGGTRSRSGSLETRLKLGLLGTAVEAQRQNYINAKQAGKTARKIFLVPLVINYHFVLEASNLIEQYLRKKGKERYYVERSEFPNLQKFINFTWRFFADKSEIILSFAPPTDIFGHQLDDEGNSIDKHGRQIDPSSYFVSGGKLTQDSQRDAEYTKMLSEHIVKAYHQYNTVLASHLVTFVAFQILHRRHKSRGLDLYGLLRLPEEDRIIPYSQYAPVVERIRDVLKKMETKGEVNLATHMHGDIDRLITYGIKNSGIYHAKDPLVKTETGNISSQDLNLLYYYHNRLKGYGLENLI